MANRLEVLTNNMNPLTKWGCGAVFMVSLVAMTWVLASYTYHIFWVTYVGKDEYKDLRAEFQMNTLQLANNAEQRYADITAAQLALQTEQATLAQKCQTDMVVITQKIDTEAVSIQQVMQKLSSLEQETARLAGSVATVQTQSYVTHDDFRTKFHSLAQIQEELAILKSAMARIAQRDAQRDDNASPR